MAKNRIEVVDEGALDPGGGPDLARFKKNPDPPGGLAPGDESKEERRKRLERERAKRRRAAAKGTAKAELAIDPSTCHFVNVFLLSMAGVVTGRMIEATPEQYETLDGSLAQIAEKYGGWLAEYMAEGTYIVTLIAIVASAPKRALEEVPFAETREQDHPDPGAQG